MGTFNTQNVFSLLIDVSVKKKKMDKVMRSESTVFLRQNRDWSCMLSPQLRISLAWLAVGDLHTDSENISLLCFPREASYLPKNWQVMCLYNSPSFTL